MLEQQPHDQTPRQREAGESDPQACEGRSAHDVLAGATFTGDIVAGISTDDMGGSPSVDWVDAQLSRIELALCVSADPATIARLLLLDVAPLLSVVQGAVYVLENGAESLSFAGSYAAGEGLPARVDVGEGLIGQCAASRRKLVVGGVSAEYFRVRSALGSGAPATLVFVPVTLEAGALAVLELAFLARGPAVDPLLDGLVHRSRRGEQLESSAPTQVTPERQAPAEALTLGRDARQGFWNTLSHELRSPLNSVIVLSQVLAENGEHNLTDKQVHLARVIHGSGKDLLALVDTVALIAKIEAHRLVLSPGELEPAVLQRQLSRAFEPLARARGLRLSVQLEPDVPRAILTDPLRARQIVECLLMAGIERADGPLVRLRIGRRQSGWSSAHQRLSAARGVLAFAVDEVFAHDLAVQAAEDEVLVPRAGATSEHATVDDPHPRAPALSVLARASALGLAISRELAEMLGGELRQDGASARLTLFLPVAGRERPALSEGRLEQAAPGPGTHLAETDGGVRGSAPGLDHERPSSAAAARAGQLDGLDLLLVDPDVRQAFPLIGHLERQGAHVAHADDLNEALERLRGRLPSAVLVDARVLRASSESSVQHLLRLAEQTPCVVLREPGNDDAGLPHVYRSPIGADVREVVALLRRVAAGPGSLQTRSR